MAEASAREATGRLEAAVRAANIGLWSCDGGGACVWLDDWCRLLDIDPCEGALSNEHWQAQVHPDDLARYLSSDLECRLGVADHYAVEYRVRTCGGRWHWLYERGGVGARGAQGQPLNYCGVCVDIDARKCAESLSRESEDRLRTLARLMEGYVFEGRLKSDGNIEFTWAEDAFLDLFECERPEVNRRGWHSFIDPRDLKEVEKRVTAVASGETVSMEVRIVGAAGGKRWLRMAAEPIRAAGMVHGLIGMAEDITERKALMEYMFASVNSEQRRIGNDLHDELGQVLTGASLLLKGYHTSALRGSAVTPGEINRVIELITGAIEHTRLLAHGLAPGRLDVGGFASALENLAYRARRWSGLKIASLPDPVHLGELDVSTSDHLYRIIQEAITNIARHAKARHAEITTRVEDGILIIAVTDDGVGIPGHVTNGFGLRTMRYRAQAIGAELTIERALPHGTRVCIRLLRRASAAPSVYGTPAAAAGKSP